MWIDAEKQLPTKEQREEGGVFVVSLVRIRHKGTKTDEYIPDNLANYSISTGWTIYGFGSKKFCVVSWYYIPPKK